MGKYVSTEFSTEGTLISVSAAPNCRSHVSFFSNVCFTSTSCLSSPLLPSSFIIFNLSSTPDEDHVSKVLVFLIGLYVSSNR